MELSINDYKAKIKADAGGVYVFAGEEDYLVRYYLSSLRGAAQIDDALAVFNNPVYDGEDVDFSAIKEAIKSPPMMSDYKLIEWKFASLDGLKESEKDAVLRGIETIETELYVPEEEELNA